MKCKSTIKYFQTEEFIDYKKGLQTEEDNRRLQNEEL